MNKRPIAVTVIACLVVATGIFAFLRHLSELHSNGLFHPENLWIPAIPLLLGASGIFILLGHGWARWLALAWIAFETSLTFSDWQKAAFHCVLFVLIAYALFARPAREFFHQGQLSN